MSSVTFLSGVDRGWSSTPCGACTRGIVFDDAVEDFKDPHRCWCDDLYDDTGCNCPAYFHRFTFTKDDDATRIMIETHVENSGARHSAVRVGEVFTFDFVPSTDDSDIAIFAPHIPLLKTVFMTPSMSRSLTDIVGRMRAKRLSISEGNVLLKTLSSELLAFIVSKFSLKCHDLRKDMRWITPIAKTLVQAIMTHSGVPAVVEHKGCAHSERKKRL